MPEVLELHDPDGSSGPPRKTTPAPQKKGSKRSAKNTGDASRWKQIAYAVIMVLVTVVALLFVGRELFGGRHPTGTNPPPPGRTAQAHSPLPPAPMMRPVPFRRPSSGSPAPILPSSASPAPANSGPAMGAPATGEGEAQGPGIN
ncbi:MAG: hypothetical protein ACP5VE_03525 [Chthonomonadales bacterium]